MSEELEEAVVETTEEVKPAPEAGSSPVEEKGNETPETPETLAEGTGKEAPLKAYWPEDWRQSFAKHEAAGDPKKEAQILKRLERYVDPTAIYAKARELEAKFSQGGLVKVPGPNAKPEEIAEYRKSIGVPDNIDGYFENLQLDNGAVLGEADMEKARSFAAAMHEVGATPEQMKRALSWYQDQWQGEAETLDVQDDEMRRAAMQELEEEYGVRFAKPNKYTNGIRSLFANMAVGGADDANPGALMNRLLSGRMADGARIGDDPAMIRFMISLAQEINPAMTVVESGREAGQAIKDEITEIRSLMRNDRRAYWNDPTKQERYRQLLEAEEKMVARER